MSFTRDLSVLQTKAKRRKTKGTWKTLLRRTGIGGRQQQGNEKRTTGKGTGKGQTHSETEVKKKNQNRPTEGKIQWERPLK